MKPLDIACRNCTAQAGENCYWNLGYHAERLEDAAVMTIGEGEPSKEEFDKAIEKLDVL